MENIFIFNYICAYIYFINISVVYYVTLSSFTHFQCPFLLSFSGQNSYLCFFIHQIARVSTIYDTTNKWIINFEGK